MKHQAVCLHIINWWDDSRWICAAPTEHLQLVQVVSRWRGVPLCSFSPVWEKNLLKLAFLYHFWTTENTAWSYFCWVSRKRRHAALIYTFWAPDWDCEFPPSHTSSIFHCHVQTKLFAVHTYDSMNMFSFDVIFLEYICDGEQLVLCVYLSQILRNLSEIDWNELLKNNIKCVSIILICKEIRKWNRKPGVCISISIALLLHQIRQYHPSQLQHWFIDSLLISRCLPVSLIFSTKTQRYYTCSIF